MKRLAGLIFIGLTACGPRSHYVADPVLVPTGAETLPTWVRQSDGGAATATLTIPADLLFSVDSSDLSPAAQSVLQQVLEEGRPATARTRVEGYADSDGDAAHNQVLSEQRANAVAAWLTARGIPAASITTRGWGETRPAVAETDDDAKAQNRRVVVIVETTQGEQR